MKLLLDTAGITVEVQRAFVVYLAGHNRPMNELLAPRLLDIKQLYEDQFSGMSRNEVSLDELLKVRRDLPSALVQTLDDDEKEFLISVKRGEPEWDRLGIDHLDQLPAIQWKLANIHRMDPGKHKSALNQLIDVLEK